MTDEYTPWCHPLPFQLVPTGDREYQKALLYWQTSLPILDHPGAFGARRKHHVHEGVDLYAPEGTLVTAVEEGRIVNIEKFTGVHTSPPSPWWEDTWAVLVEGASGVVVYGEVTPGALGDTVKAGDPIGHVRRVLKVDKGYPMSMLHMELHVAGTMRTSEWTKVAPASLKDPTPKLLLMVLEKMAAL